jgi:hypothetical protein
MNNKTNDGGPAFPACNEANVNGTMGMTLRDVFAKEAIGCWRIDKDDLDVILTGGIPDHKMVAKFCYGLADAMIKARGK